MEIKLIIAEFPNFKPDMRKVAIVLQHWTITHMAQGRDFYGVPYAPLKIISTISRRGNKHLPLRDTGRLKQSIRVYPEGEAVVFKSNVVYATTHQFGAIITPKRARFLIIPANTTARYQGKVPGSKWFFARKTRIPPRPFFPLPGKPLPDELLRRLQDAI